jgi:uncharacterized protein YndB with AHSA1/START domain
MAAYIAQIERSNRKDLSNVEVQVTVSDPGAGRQSWKGEFVSRSADGIVPNERLALTFDTGQKTTALVSETLFDSRTPDTTVVHVKGTGPLM